MRLQISALLTVFFSLSCSNLDVSEIPPPGNVKGREIMVQEMPDPIEHFNRTSFAIHRYLFEYVVHPITQGYNWLLPEEGRKGISRFYTNVKFPIRLVSNLLQTKFDHAWTETQRFGINTTEGILGFTDPATEKYKITAKDEDLGQTFGYWGWENSNYIYLPFVGPGSTRDYIGKVGDYFLDPASYYSPAKYALSFNDISLFARFLYETLIKEYDPYTLTKILYSVSRDHAIHDRHFNPEKDDTAQVQTIRAIFATPKDPFFVSQSSTGEVKPKNFVKNLAYSFWNQGKPAPLAIILPGLGSHRLGKREMTTAECAFNAGYHVLTISNTFNWEFLAAAPKDYLPGHIIDDADIMRQVYEAIHDQLTGEFGQGYLKHKALLGMSMGAWYTLNFAALQVKNDLDYKIDKYIAINPPIDLINSLKAIDSLYMMPLKNRTVEESKKITKSALVKALVSFEQNLKPTMPLPFTDSEASYLIGLSFKFTLREMILETEFKKRTGPLTPKTKIYDYLNAYSYYDYYDKFIKPALIKKGVSKEEFIEYSDLKNSLEYLKKVKGIHLVLTENDFLLSKGDLNWFKENFKGKYTLYQKGGHLGNVWQDDFRELLKKKLKE